MKKILFILNLFVIMITVFGQNEYHYYKPSITPSSPDQSSLLKYFETPVSPSNGTTGINIPLYTINQAGIKFPIELTYNASGIRVNEVASSVGLGWNLNIPKIVRVVKGIPDDSTRGFMFEDEYTVEAVKSISECQSIDPIENPNACDNEMKFIQTNIKKNALDLESDLYSVSLPSGENIQFMFNQNRSPSTPYGEIVTFPKSFVKIKPIITNNKISSWEITDINGTKYFFNQGDYSTAGKSYSYGQGGDLPTIGTPNSYSFISSWNISQIMDIKNQQLNFSYQTKPINSNCHLTNQLWNIQGLKINNSTKSEEINKVIQSINGDFGSIEFTNSTRDDYDGGYKIDKIKVFSPNITTPMMTIELNYDYTIADQVPNNLIYCDKILNSSSPEILQISKRMFLESVVINDKNLEQTGVYELVYNEGILPHRFSFSQDWWGFYNDENNSSLVYNPRSTYGDQDWNNYNRHVNHEKSQAGMLKKIIFPTGGSTEFEFENNRGVFKHKGLLFHLNNIIPPKYKTEIFSFSSGSEWEIIDNNVVYDDIPFSIDEDVINYYRANTNDNNLYIDVYANVSFGYNNICVGPIGDDLPTNDQCHSKFYLLDSDDNILSEHPSRNDGFQYKFQFPVGHFQTGLAERGYKIRLIGFSGTGPQHYDYDPFNELIQINFNWDIYDPELVNHVGLFDYEIPIGGLRTKKITVSDNDNEIKLIKEYDYKDQLGVESGLYNVNLDYFQAINRIPTVNSNNGFPLQTSGSNVIIYTDTKEILINYLNPAESITTTYKNNYLEGVNNYGCHYMAIPEIPYHNSKSTPCFQHPQNGKLWQTNLGDKKRIEYEYNSNGGIPFNEADLTYVSGVDYNATLFFTDIGVYDGFCSVNCLDGLGTPEFLPFEDYFYYVVNQFYDEPVKKVTTTTQLNPDIVETVTTEYHSDYPILPIKNETANSLGESLTTEYQYPQDLSGQRPWMATLVAENRIADPVVTKTYNVTQNKPLSVQETVYEKDATTGNLLLPKHIFAKKGSETLNYSPTGGDLKITYDRYDTNGNLQQYTLADGTPVSIIWGYNGQYPIAKVEGVAYADIETQATVLSNNNNLTELSFDSLRTLVNDLTDNNKFGMLTCYIYEPLVGVKMIIQPNGQTEYYEYDNAGRLIKVKDHEGNELKKTDYHYYNQP